MRGKSNFYKHLVRIFWLSLIVGTVGIWYYVDRSIPDRVSVTEHDQEEFTFSLPWRATVYSESEEVALLLHLFLFHVREVSLPIQMHLAVP